MTDIITIQTQGSSTLVQTVKPAGATRLSVDYTLPASSVAQEIDLTMVRTAVQYLLMCCDQNCTVKTNSSSVPNDTIALTANVPLLVGLAGNVPVGTQTAAAYFTADITKLFVINGVPAGTATFQLRGILT